VKSIGARFLLPLGVIAVFFSVFILHQTYQASRENAEGLMSEQAALALEFNLAIRDYATEKIRPAMERALGKDAFIPEAMSTFFISKAVSERVQRNFPAIITRFSSESPRNPLNLAGPDELRMIEYFRRNPTVSRQSEEIRIEGRRYQALFTPKWMKQECLHCHGDPKDAPAELIRRYGSTAGFYRKVGDVAGLDMVAVPLDAMNLLLAKEARGRSLTLGAGIAFLFGLILITFHIVVTRRLRTMAEHLHQIAADAEGPWKVPVEVGGNDEVNLVGEAFNKLLSQLRDSHDLLEKRVLERTEELRQSNDQLQVELAERKRAEEAARQREREANRLAQENAIMADIGSIINASLELDEVYERFARELRKLIPSDRIVINLVDHREKVARIAYVSGGDLSDRMKGAAVPLNAGLAGWIVQSRQAAIIPSGEIGEYARRFPGLGPAVRAGYRSIMAVPLISKGVVISNILFWSTSPDRYSEEDLRLASRVGYQITSAIVNSLTFADQKRAEKALQESEQRFKDLYDNAPTGYHEYDLEGRITSVNQTELDLLGYTMEEMLGKFVWSLCAEPELVRVEILSKLEGVPSADLEFERKYRRKDGSLFPVLIKNRTVLDEQGRMRGVRSTLQDITEQKRAEQELREKDEFTSSLLKHSPIAVQVLNEDTSIQYVNLAHEKLTGYRADEIVGKRAPYPWWAEGTTVRERVEHLRTGVTGIEKSFRKKNGETFWVEITSTPLIGDREPKYALTIWVDITERKRAEEEKEKLQARLQRAQKMEAIGTLAGGVAHDLNNLLSGIVSYPDLLLMQLPEGSPFRKPVMTIRESGKRAAAIVQDLLTLARRAVPTTEVVDLNGVVSEYLRSPEYEKLISFHPNVQVRTRLEPGLLHLLGSPLHLSKTLMNLISNAAEAMPQGGEVLVTTENRYVESPIRGYDHVEGGDYVVLSVTDTGVGISPADRERIFEPFYTKKIMGRSGTGLGMAVVWGAVKDHKGYIDVLSIEGKGTTFTLYFPVTRKEPVTENGPVAVERHNGKGETILVVDDVETQREIASALLSYLGYGVAAVSSGEEAVEYVKKSPVDLIVLDMIMSPGMDGLETYRKIRELRPSQKAILASGFSETFRVREAQTLGAGQYIRKPYTLGKIAAAVRNELDC
jgi:PAS domain S-box-containing protein